MPVLALLFWALWVIPGCLWGILDVVLVNWAITSGINPLIVTGGVVSIFFHVYLFRLFFFHNFGPAEAGLGPGLLMIANFIGYLIAVVATVIFFLV